MPRYFFDTYDGNRFIPDHEGLELRDLTAAERETRKALPDMARDALPDGDQQTFVVNVRNEAGHVVLRAALSLVVENFPEEPPAES